MSEHEQIQHFADELDKLVDRFRSEYEIAYGSIIGALHIKAHDLIDEANDRNKGEY